MIYVYRNNSMSVPSLVCHCHYSLRRGSIQFHVANDSVVFHFHRVTNANVIACACTKCTYEMYVCRQDELKRWMKWLCKYFCKWHALLHSSALFVIHLLSIGWILAGKVNCRILFNNAWHQPIAYENVFFPFPSMRNVFQLNLDFYNVLQLQPAFSGGGYISMNAIMVMAVFENISLQFHFN